MDALVDGERVVVVEAGDLIVVPKNRHHRFMLTESKTIRCVRLFREGYTNLGQFTLQNYADLTNELPLNAYLNSIEISLVTAMSLALVLQSFAASTQVAWFAELFATKSRATGTGIAVSLAAAVFGGTAPYLNTWLTSRDSADLFTWYVVALALCVAVAAYFTRETKGTALTATHVPNPAATEPTAA